MDRWRDFFAKAGVDIWTVIEKAIILAAVDCPKEFKDKRSDIAETLFARNLLNVPCRDVKLSGSIVTNLTNLNLENKLRNDEEVAGQKLGADQEGHRCSYGDAEALTDEIEEEALVLKDIYRIRETITEPDQSEKVLLDSLQRLEYLQITVEVLKATELGKHVNGLRKHSSKHVRNLAKQLVRGWKELVDEWMKSTGEVAEAALAGSEEGEPVDLHKRDHGLASPPLDEGALLAARTSSLDVSQLFSFIDDIPGCGDTNNQVNDLSQVVRSSCPSSKCESMVTQTDKRKSDIEACISYEGHEYRVPEERGSTTRVSYEGIEKLELDPEPYSRNLARQDARYKQEINENSMFRGGNNNNGSGSQGRTAKDSAKLKASAPSGSSGSGRPVISPNVLKASGIGLATCQLGMTSKPSVKPSCKDDNAAEKLEFAKRKLHEGYQHAENAKKQHVVQILDLSNLPKGGPNRAKTKLLSETRPGSQSWHWAQSRK